jgi:hypothetical protein
VNIQVIVLLKLLQTGGYQKTEWSNKIGPDIDTNRHASTPFTIQLPYY